MSILIVEPQTDERNLFEHTLRNAGYNHLTFISKAEECLARLGITDVSKLGLLGYDFELILLGSTSVEDCFETCRQIKQSFHFQDIPVIVSAGGAVADGLPMVLAYGAHDYIRKPFIEYEFLARVRSALRLKHEIDRRKARERELIEATRQLSYLNSMLTRLSLIDGLTGIANRRNFDRVHDLEWRRASRNNHEISLIMIDIDHFKAYNDHYGHQGGDECLRLVARTLKEALRRPGDALCRYGGEEFGVILPETSREGALTVAENLRLAIDQAKIPHRASTIAGHVTLSLGVATLLPAGILNFKQLIEEADQSLYQAKVLGRNRVTCHQGESQKAV